MFKKTPLGEVLETTCNQCKSRFRITEKQLRQAYGKVHCGECGCVFNALTGLKDLDHEAAPGYLSPVLGDDLSSLEDDLNSLADDRTLRVTDFDHEPFIQEHPDLSLEEAMYGTEGRSFFSLTPLVWFIGILLLTAVGLAQIIYYQRYQLIEDPRFQQQVINLCQLLPCAETEFSSTEQIKLLERNVFTHPVATDALMVTGSFVNQAPFAQKLPDLLISLFDLHGNLIANRLFLPTEYLLEDKNRGVMQPEIPIQFRLEIVDPGTDALTYEFEFF